MAKYLHRIGAQHIKFDLDVTVHYLKLNTNTQSLIKIRVKRKDKVEETQPMQYSPSLKRLNFDYPLNFTITMYKKGGKFSKKDLQIKVLEVQGKSEVIMGTFTIEFHKMAEKDQEIRFEEFPLVDCKDSKARLCVSVSLIEKDKNGGVNVKRAVSVGAPIAWEDKKEVKTQALSDDEGENKSRRQSVKNIRSAFAISEDLLNEINETRTKEATSTFIKTDIIEIEEPAKEEEEIRSNILETEIIERKNEEVFNDFQIKNDYKSDSEEELIQPREAETENKPVEKDTLSDEAEKTEEKEENKEYEFLKSEEQYFEHQVHNESVDSSSSDEALEAVPIENPDLDLPISNMKETAPNSASQELRLNLKEKEAGLPESRNQTCCAKCCIF